SRSLPSATSSTPARTRPRTWARLPATSWAQSRRSVASDEAYGHIPGGGAPANPPAHNGRDEGSSPIRVDPGPGAGGQPPQGHEPPPGVVVEGVPGLVGGQVGPVQGPLGPPGGGLRAARRNIPSTH